MAQHLAPDSQAAVPETPRDPNKLQSITALARFEFEPGKSNDGSKILMVEWEDDDATRSPGGSWNVSWNGKKTVLPADEKRDERVRRCYFLLPPGATIPASLTLTYEPPPNSAKTVKEQDTLQVNPLPAIFPPELGATARSAGKKGVLHTIWAKKRLQSLEKEIKAESVYNSEGVALQMALQEKEWIASNFGVSGRSAASQPTSSSPAPISPISTPISPTGGKKLTDKLKGLKLQTSENDLSRNKNTGSSQPDPNLHPLSPDEPDVAISSFSSFHNSTPISQPPRQQPAPASGPTKHAVAQAPPEHLQFQQQQGQGFASLSMNPIGSDGGGSGGNTDSGNDLFAKALSPRSPDIPKSPFSFSAEETLPHAMQKLNG